jgi:precorrin-6B methylase 2
VNTTYEEAGVIPSISIDALLAARDGAHAAFLEAKRLLDAAAERLQAFGVRLPDVEVEFPGNTYRSLRDERYAEPIANEIDRFVWLQLFKLTNIDTIMDHKTRNELFERLHRSRAYLSDQDDALPPLTKENIEATFAAVHAQQGEFFEKCVESVYNSLSWDHKTNEPAKIGDKLIVNGAFYQWSRALQGNTVSLNNHESLHDLERVLCILDGQAPPTHGTGLRALQRIPYGQWVEVPSPSGGAPLLQVKCFRKGTTHVRILNTRHVDAMNRIMAHRHPGAIPEPAESKASRRRGEAQRPVASTAVAKSEKAARQAFYTPEDLAAELVEAAGVGRGDRVLEPSAGEGAIVRAALRRGAAHVTAVENDPRAVELLGYLAERVAKRGHNAVRVIGCDFFDFKIRTLEDRFDAVVMNPPFANAQEVEHVLRAWTYVKPGGRLVSVMSAAAASRQTGRYGALAAFLEKHGAEIRPLAPGAFKDAGTDVNTVMVIVEKPA